MRLLILSDIHANWAALRSVREEFDACLFLGDLVDYGPRPGPCIDWAREHADFAVRGNHDHAVAQRVAPNSGGGFRYLTAVTRPVSTSEVTPARRRYLAGLPVSQSVTFDGRHILMVHGTPRDPLEEYGQNDVDFWAARLQDVTADLICVGHTHHPYCLQVGDKTVLNPGSVGMPRDGDPRASYAIVEGGEVELKRIEYPVDETVAAVWRCPIPESAKCMLADVYRTGRLTAGRPARGAAV